MVVKTKEELKKAMDDKVDVIIAEGELAEYVGKMEKVTKAGPAAIAALVGGLLALPTGGVSLAAAAPLGAFAGVAPAVLITLISFFEVAFIVALIKEYDIETEEKSVDGTVKKVKLTHK